MPSLDPHVNTPPQLVMSLRSIYPSPHEHSKDPNVFVQVWLQGLVGTHSSLSIGNNNRTTWMNLICSKTLHCNTRTFLNHFIILPIHVCWSNLFRTKPVGQNFSRPLYPLTNTCLLIKSVKNKASGTEALLHSINDCTGARATTITSTGLIGCSENRVAVMTIALYFLYLLKNKNSTLSTFKRAIVNLCSLVFWCSSVFCLCRLSVYISFLATSDDLI